MYVCIRVSLCVCNVGASVIVELQLELLKERSVIYSTERCPVENTWIITGTHSILSVKSLKPVLVYLGLVC